MIAAVFVDNVISFGTVSVSFASVSDRLIGESAVNKSKSKKSKRANSKPNAAKPKTAKSVQKKPEGTMDRPTLVGIARLLKDAGSGVRALKSDDDAELQKKINEAIHELPSAEIVKQLEAIDPDKLINVLKQDCLGIFVDLSDVSCIHCPDAKSCVAAFVGNLQGGFVRLQGAMITKTDDKAAPEPPRPAVVPVTRYEATRLVFVRDVPNPNPEGNDYHDTIEHVLKDQPETLKELRAIVEQDFDLDNDGDFMKFVTALRDPKEGVIKLDVDLSKKDRAALREAGYDV